MSQPSRREHYIGVFLDDIRLGVELGNIVAAGELGSPPCAKFGGQRFEFVAHHAPKLLLGAKNGLDLLGLACFLLELVENLLNFQLGDLVELGVENRIDLDFIELERGHQLLGGIRLALALTDDADGAIEGVEDDLETLKDVNPLAKLLQLELEALAHRRQTKVEEIAQYFLEPEPARLRLAVGIGHQASQVDREVFLQCRVLIEICHHQVRIGIGFDFQGDAQTIFLVGFVREVDKLRQLAGRDDLADIAFQRPLVDAIGDRRDHDLLFPVCLLDLPFGLDADAALAVFVGLAQRRPIGDNLPSKGKIGSFDFIEQRRGRGFRVVDQHHRGANHVRQIVRRNVGGHADGDAGGPVD